MTDPMRPAESVFLPWLRRGLGTRIGSRGVGPDGGRASIRVDVDIERVLERTGAARETRTATVTLPMFGPEDVTGLDPRCVQRVWPQPDTSDAEQNFLPLIEFSEPDLPWRYTPAAPTEANRLQPWLCLLVLAEGEYEFLPSGQDRPLAEVRVLASLPAVGTEGTVNVPLPDLADAWAWAHGEVGGTAGAEGVATGLEGILAGAPERVCARLLAPRRLLRRTRYLAVVVPTFERGRLAGLREAVGSVDGMAPAWRADSPRPLRLPVYHHWHFGTGEEGSFQTLARRLEMRTELPAGVGRRTIDVRGASPRLTAMVGQEHVETAGLEGALVPLRTAPPAPTPADPPVTSPPPNKPVELVAAEPGGASLATLLDDINASQRSSDRRPVVGPPPYGLWYSVQPPLSARLGASAIPWFAGLNLDARRRIPAGMGTQVVQEHQQALMAGAWAQLENLRAINESLRFSQVSREAARRIYRRDIVPASAEVLLQFTAPVHAQVMAGTTTVRAVLAGSPIDAGVFQPQWRRLGRLRGPLGRRQGRPSVESPPLLDRMNRGELAAARPPIRPAALNTALDALDPLQLDGDLRKKLLRAAAGTSVVGQLLVSARRADGRAGAPSDVLRRLQDKADQGLAPRTPEELIEVIRDASPRPDFTPVEDTGRPTGEGEGPRITDAAAGDRDSTAAGRLRYALTQLVGALGGAPTPAPTPAPVDLAALAGVLREALDPEHTMAAAMRARLQLHSPRARQNPDDPLEPVMAYPEFPQPMYEPLRDLSQEWLLPGLDRVPNNTLALLRTNQPFVEAYMVGLNHEMSRELLWNEFPTDQRGTYFRRFWRAVVPDPEAPPPYDITEIHTWLQRDALGTHRATAASGTRAESIVLLLRGDLLQRYPTAIAYAVRSPDGDAPDVRFPSFLGTLKPDVTFVGFPLTGDQLRREAGWFFAIQEQLNETRFAYPEARRAQTRAESTWFRVEGEGSLAGFVTGALTTAAQVAGALAYEPVRLLIEAQPFVAALPTEGAAGALEAGA